MKLSIILPLNKTHDTEFSSALHDEYKGLPDVEILEIPDQPTLNRAGQFNLGLKEAKGEIVLLHHSRSIIERAGIEHLLQNEVTGWGGFTHRFDATGVGYSFTSWYSNKVRADKRGIFYLDHCIFAEKSLLERIGGVPDIDIFEDTALSHKLSTLEPGKRLPQFSTTSSQRFKENGFLYQSCMNQLLKFCYALGISDRILNTIYEEY